MDVASSVWLGKETVRWRLRPFSGQLPEHGVVQKGYELVLSGRFHPAGPTDLEARARALHLRLRGLALEAIGDAPPEVWLYIGPLGRGTLAADERLAVEVELVVLASLAHSDRLPPRVATQQRICELEARLRAIGLPPRSRAPVALARARRDR
jgi:hypothetical protein